VKTAYTLFHKTHPDEAATDRRGTYPTLSGAKAATGYQHLWEDGDQTWRAEEESCSHWFIVAEPVAENDAESVALALETIRLYGDADGESHKAWVLDQVARHLARNSYGAWVDDMDYWDEGIAP